MRAETVQQLKELEQKLFCGNDFKGVRKSLGWTPQNSGEAEDVEILLDRVEEFAPDMQKFWDSFLELDKDQ